MMIVQETRSPSFRSIFSPNGREISTEAFVGRYSTCETGMFSGPNLTLSPKVHEPLLTSEKIFMNGSLRNDSSEVVRDTALGTRRLNVRRQQHVC